MVERAGIEPAQSKQADLQSAELTTCSTYPRRGIAGNAAGCGGPDPGCSVGADDGTRTRNRRFTKPLLYQLSYVGAQGHTAEKPEAPKNDRASRGTGQARSDGSDEGGGPPGSRSSASMTTSDARAAVPRARRLRGAAAGSGSVAPSAGFGTARPLVDAASADAASFASPGGAGSTACAS